jgi:hypothetical protein
MYQKESGYPMLSMYFQPSRCPTHAEQGNMKKKEEEKKKRKRHDKNNTMMPRLWPHRHKLFHLRRPLVGKLLLGESLGRSSRPQADG